MIIFLVADHAFAIYTGAWRKPVESFPYVAPYDWIGEGVYSCMLESFVFISGIVFGFAILRNPNRMSFDYCVKAKAKRLLLPCVIFSLAYMTIFWKEYQNCSLPELIMMPFRGAGHMWFLPVLFWCFVFTYLIERKWGGNVKQLYLFAVLSIINPFIVTLSFGLNVVLSYYFFFYAGFLIGSKHLRLPIPKHPLMQISVFVAAFIIHMKLKYNFEATTYLERYSRYVIRNVPKFIMASIGVYMLHYIANKQCLQRALGRHDLLITLSNYCYGVYICQQFVLWYIYYATDIVMEVNVLLLPWLTFSFTLLLSVIITHFSLKTKIGRFLIG